MTSKAHGSDNPKNWMELDYFQRPSPFRRLQKRLLWMTMLLSPLALVALHLTPRSQTVYQPHPVASSHRTFNHDCAQCHQKTFQPAKRLISWDRSIRSVPDHACTQCHPGTPHHPTVAEQKECAVCHREHEGKTDLTKVDDRHCLRCHSDLKANHKDPAGARFQNVTGFPQGHPPFAQTRVDQKDPGQLRFSHERHLRPLPVRPGGTLSCQDCHQLDPSGQYFQPIDYEKHCTKCHPLSVQLGGAFADESAQEAMKKFNSIPAPHLAPELVRGALRERLLDFSQKTPVIVGAKAKEWIQPKTGFAPWAGGVVWTSSQRRLTAEERQRFVELQLSTLERALFHHSGGCQQCHLPSTPPEEWPPNQLPDFRRTNLPARWFHHSRFDHKPHRSQKCSECHSASTSDRTRDVILPTLQNCAKCHNSEVGAPTSCATCHLYHPR